MLKRYGGNWWGFLQSAALWSGLAPSAVASSRAAATRSLVDQGYGAAKGRFAVKLRAELEAAE